MSEAEIMAAIARVNDALMPFLDGEPDTMAVQEACLALENVERLGGASSLTVAKLRRELEKRGLTRDPICRACKQPYSHHIGDTNICPWPQDEPKP